MQIYRSQYGEVSQLGNDETTLEAWFDLAERVTRQHHAELVTAIRHARDHMERRLAALFMSAAELADPEDRFYADILLVITVHDGLWRKDVEEAIAASVFVLFLHERVGHGARHLVLVVRPENVNHLNI